MKKLLLTLAVLIGPLRPAAAFNLWDDIKLQTQWTLGSAVAAGTSIAMRSDSSSGLKAGQFVGSALAQISNYRMLSLWGGGTFVPQADRSLKAVESAKIGINLGYLFKGFTNPPPALIQNLVVGPSLSMPIWTTPHVVIPFFDANYAFGGTTAPATPPTAAPTVPIASRLNLFWRA